MKQLVEFKNHAGYVPYFIETWCPLVIGNKMIGVAMDDEECYVPHTLVILTRDEVIGRVIAADITHVIGNEQVPYTTEEKQCLAEDWLTLVGF